MKGLLLLFILFPAVLFGQDRHNNVVDSIKEAATTGLQQIGGIVDNSPGIAARQIAVSDSGDYMTIVVRVRLAQTPIASIGLQPYLPIELAAAPKARLPILALPVLSPETEPITALELLPFVRLEIKNIAASDLGTLLLPALPALAREVDSVTTILPAEIYLPKVERTATKMGAIELPKLPDLLADPVAMRPLPIMKLPFKNLRGTARTLTAPDFAEKRMPVAEMHLSDEGYSLLEKLEGFSPDLYNLRDGGYTIGFGFFMPYSEGHKWNKGMTQEAAERIMRQKMPAYEDQVKRYINVPLTQNEFDALTMLAYNLGGFSKATSIVNDINGRADAEKLRGDWNKFVHSKAPGVTKGLMNRRKDEIGVQQDANYQPERKLLTFKRR